MVHSQSACLATVPVGDSTVAAKLKEAGAIILGKANLSQWSNHRSSNFTQGWSSRGGQCTGVYTEYQNPSGSSSGSGSASALGLALASIGTETSGSIVRRRLLLMNANVFAILPDILSSPLGRSWSKGQPLCDQAYGRSSLAKSRDTHIRDT